MTGGRVIRADAIHLTAVFLGSVAPERLDLAIEVARAVRAERHELMVDEARYWPHNRIVWAGPSQVPQETLSIAAQLKAGLLERGFELEKRDFVAHITLIRKAASPSALPPLAPVRWPVEDIVLARSRQAHEGPGYEIVERFSLPLG